MANRFLDSMQHYGTANINKKYNILNGGSFSSWAIGAAASPRGTDVLQIASDGTGGFASAFLGRTFEDQDTWIVGFRLNYPAVACGAAIFKFFDHNGAQQFTLANQFGGQLGVYRGGIGGFGGAGTLLGVSAGAPLFSGVWAYIEIKLVIHPSAGSVQVRIDNSLVINLSGINTDNSGLGSASVLGFGGGSCGTTKFCDFYVHDGNGSDDIDFWGDTFIDYIIPVADGSVDDFSTVGSSDHFENVDELVPDTADYNFDSVIGNQDLYVMQTITGTPIIKGIQGVALMEKDDGNDRRVQITTKIGGVDYPDVAQDVPSSSGYLLSHWGDSPATAVDWDITEANAAEFGVTVEN